MQSFNGIKLRETAKSQEIKEKTRKEPKIQVESDRTYPKSDGKQFIQKSPVGKFICCGTGSEAVRNKKHKKSVLIARHEEILNTVRLHIALKGSVTTTAKVLAESCLQLLGELSFYNELDDLYLTKHHRDLIHNKIGVIKQDIKEMQDAKYYSM